MKLEYKGQELSFEFGLHFLGKAQSALGYLDFNELLKNIKSRADIVDLMYVSAKDSAFLDDKPFNITKREWVNAFESDEIQSNKIVEWEGLFVESINGIFGLESPKEDVVEDEDVKKK